MIRLAWRLRAEQSGFTLIELLVACTIGTIVILASFMLLDSTVVLSGKVTERVDRTQRGRLAMELIARELRSQVCVQGGLPAIADGQSSSITFYSFMGSGAFVPDKHQVYADSATSTIVDKTWKGAGTAPNTTFPASPTTTATVLADAGPPTGSTPMFAYYAANSATPLAVPLSAADTANTSKVTISFLTYASGRNATGSSTTFQNEVFSRSSDPNGLFGSTAPMCA